MYLALTPLSGKGAYSPENLVRTLLCIIIPFKMPSVKNNFSIYLLSGAFSIRGMFLLTCCNRHNVLKILFIAAATRPINSNNLPVALGHSQK